MAYFAIRSITMKLNKLTLAAGMLLAIAGGAAQVQALPVKNIVLVHGASAVRAGVRCMTV
jgi:hypothetical protein